MKRSFDAIAIFLCAALALISSAQNWDQEWRMKTSSDPGKVHFSIERSRPGHRWNNSSDMPLESFRGLSLQALSSGGPAKFEFVRDAGRLVCQGQFTTGRGIGSFEFAPNPQYSTELQRLGYEAPQEDQLFSMLMSDVSLDFARGVKQANVPSTTKQLLEMRIHGVTLDYIQRMRSGGYTNLDAKNYVEMRIHGVTPELVAELKKAGYDLPAKKVVEMKIHGVSPEYIRELNGYGLRPDASEIVEMRIHGVKLDFIQAAKNLGYNFTGKELIQLRIHGVNEQYLRKLKDSGFQNLTADKIVKLRIHGID
jgi:hypothetical protein